MKRFVWLVGGLCAATAGFLVWGRGSVAPIDRLADRAEESLPEHPVGV